MTFLAPALGVPATPKRVKSKMVDGQNACDSAYRKKSGNFSGPACRAATALVLKGMAQPSGCTAPLVYGGDDAYFRNDVEVAGLQHPR